MVDKGGDKPRVPAPAKKHGCVGARRWLDIRQAARVARTEGVTLNIHGITVSPCKPQLDIRQGPKRENAGVTMCDESKQQPVESGGAACNKSSKVKERDARRLLEFQESKRPLSAASNRWALLVQKSVRVLQFHTRSTVWVEWMKQKPLRESLKAHFPRTAVVATSFGGDPDAFADKFVQIERIEEEQQPVSSEVPPEPPSPAAAVPSPAPSGAANRSTKKSSKKKLR